MDTSTKHTILRSNMESMENRLHLDRNNPHPPRLSNSHVQRGRQHNSTLLHRNNIDTHATHHQPTERRKPPTHPLVRNKRNTHIQRPTIRLRHTTTLATMATGNTRQIPPGYKTHERNGIIRGLLNPRKNPTHTRHSRDRRTKQNARTEHRSPCTHQTHIIHHIHEFCG